MFNTYFIDVLKNHYFDFKGIATRKQYWMYVLCYIIVAIVLGIVASFLGKVGNAITTLFSLALLLPSLSIAARRLHDTGRSAWWLLISLVPAIGGIILLVFLVLPSKK